MHRNGTQIVKIFLHLSTTNRRKGSARIDAPAKNNAAEDVADPDRTLRGRDDAKHAGARG